MHSHNLEQLVLKRFKILTAGKLRNQKRWNQLILRADARDAAARSPFRLRRQSTSALCRVDLYQTGLTVLGQSKADLRRFAPPVQGDVHRGQHHAVS